MSSPLGLPLDPPAPSSSAPSSSAPTLPSTAPTPPCAARTSPTPPPPQRSQPLHSTTPLKPSISPTAITFPSSDSEAETVVVKKKKQPVVDSDRQDSKLENEDESEGDAARRPRRRKRHKVEEEKALHGRKSRGGGVSGGSRGAGGGVGGGVASRIVRAGRRFRDNEVDDAYSSDLSSVPSRSPRPVSPSAPHARHYHTSKNATFRASKKRKILDPPSSDDNDDLEHRNHHHRMRQSIVIEQSPTIISISSSSPTPPGLDSSPTKITRTRGVQTGHKVLKHRKVPPPLDTAKERISGDEKSSSSSRNGSPSTVPRSVRPSSVRTPGSPINMTHKPKRDTAGRTILHKACQRGAVAEVVSILEQNKELLNEEDNAGYMALHEACLYGHLSVVKLLINAGAWVDVPSRLELDTPLLDAVNNGHTDVVRFILELGADPRRRNKLGQNAKDVNEANNADRPEVYQEIDELLTVALTKLRSKRSSDDENNRASVPADSHSSRDPSVASPVHQSPPAQSAPPARRRNARTEQSRKDLLWLDAGKNGILKLREKAREGDQQMVHALLERGTKPDTESLIGAIKGGHTDTVSLLLAYNAIVDPEPGPSRDGNRRNRDGSLPAGEETPMNAAIGRGNLEILRYLLENGASARRLDSRGKTYIEIAEEREGELWQQEVELLKRWWDKTEGPKVSGGKAADKLRSPPSNQRRCSPRPKRPNGSKRNPPSPRRPDASVITVQTNGASSASASANPASSSKYEDTAMISDYESDAEPLGPPKNRGRKPRRSDPDFVPPVVAKPKRRLISGKDLAEEKKARSQESTKSSPQDLDTDASERSSGPTRGITKRVERKKKAEAGETKRDSKRSARKITSNADDTNQEQIADRNGKATGIQRDEHLAPRENSTMLRKRSPKKRDRTRSPPRAHSDSGRSDQETKKKRKVDDRPDDHPPPRYDSDGNTRRIRDDRRRDDARRKIEDPPRRKDPEESRRPIGDEAAAKPRQYENRRRRLRDMEDDRRAKETERREWERRESERREREREKEREREREKEREREREREKERREEQMRRAQKESEEAKERKRQEVLTQELASIQAKALEESKEARAEAERERLEIVIARELALRNQREEADRREREAREREERELKERKAKAKAKAEAEREKREALEREAREREERELEEREAKAKAKAEAEKEKREALEREALEREAKEREHKERLAAKEREREAREKEERKEREARELEQRRLLELKHREEEKRREEERKREEERRAEEERLKEERRREEEAEKERRRQEEEKRRRAAEEERKRLEIEKAQREKEAHDRKLAEELQRQLAAAEKRRLDEEAKAEAARIEALPFALRELEKIRKEGLEYVEWNKFLPMKTATFESVNSPLSIAVLMNSNANTNGTGEMKAQKYVSNIQAALALGLTDITFSGYREFKHRSATEHEKRRMWGVLNAMLCEPMRPGDDRPFEELIKIREKEEEKFLHLTHIFWIKLEDFKHLVNSDPQYKHLTDKLNVTVEIDIVFSPPGSVSKEEMDRRLSRVFPSWGKKRVVMKPPGVGENIG